MLLDKLVSLLFLSKSYLSDKFSSFRLVFSFFVSLLSLLNEPTSVHFLVYFAFW